MVMANPKDKRVSLTTIAESIGVSKVTISKALNDKEGVSDELRKEIKAKAKELNYHINVIAKGLKTNQTYNIGILIPERFVQTSNNYYFELYTKMAKKFNELNYTAVMEILEAKSEENLEFPKMYNHGKIDALIIMGQCNKDYLKLFCLAKMPVIFFDFYDSEIQVDSIIVDNYYSGTDITKLLIKNGHKDIAFIGNIYSTSSIRDRFLGYYRALLEANIEINYDYVISDRDNLGNLHEFELPKNMPTAFVCNNDQLAYNLLNRLIEKGYKVPEDVSIVTFDNTIYSELSSVKLTSVDNNDDELVAIAVKAIIKKLSKPEKVYDRILVKARIVERDSVKDLKGEIYEISS